MAEGIGWAAISESIGGGAAQPPGVRFVAMSEVPVLGDMVFVSCLRSLLDKGVAMYGGIEQTAMMRFAPRADINDADATLLARVLFNAERKPEEAMSAVHATAAGH